jgi:DNA-binding response OmpR family regulator
MTTHREVKVRVLVVDDEEVIADTLAIILTLNGFETSAAYSGEEAVEAAIAFQPQVVISDIMMGKLNGLEAAIRIRAGAPNCEFLLISGHPSTTELIKRAGAGGNHFTVIAKPIHPQAILDRLAALHGRRASKSLALEDVDQLRGMDGFCEQFKGTAISERMIEQVGSRRVA